jgi:peptide/nickel transport system permease protein
MNGGRTRSGLYVLTLLVVFAVNFALPRVMPGDPLAQLGDPGNTQFVADDETRARVLAYYGLDRSLPEQFAAYAAGLAQGDLGTSIQYNAPVAALIAGRLPWTLLLVLLSLALASVIALVGGVEAAWRRGGAGDRAIVGAFILAESVPVFVVGILLTLVFSVRLGWFPLGGAFKPFSTTGPLGTALDVLSHLALPVATLTLSLVGTKFLLVRASVVTVLGEPFMTVARAKGLDERRLRYRHALRNALLPFVTQLSLQLGFAMGGAVLIETLFAYPGMGRLLFDAVAYRDYPLIQGTFLVISATVLIANLAVEAVYRRIDPRLL